ncbi:MAG: outer membrane beta-barrel protein [Longimicrobiales bacterium]
MRRFGILFLVSLAVLSLGITTARAQEGAFAFEIRGGAGLPTSAFRTGGDGWVGKTGIGASFGMGFTLPAPGPFGVLLGFGQRRFGCQGEVCAEGADWISTGFDVALRLVLGRKRIRPWFKGGLHTHRLEGSVLGMDGGFRDLNSDGGYGFEAGGGILVAIGERSSLSPGLHYGWGEVPFPDRSDLRLQYFMIDLGLVLGF